MEEIIFDPLQPPKFKHKPVPKANGLRPVPVLQSPPRPPTVEDQKDWTITLDKWLAADGRGLQLQEVQVNDYFAKLSEALYAAEKQAIEAISMRAKVQKLEAKDAAKGKKHKIMCGGDCDICEKVALGMASARGGEVMYDDDQRLFNQEKGMNSGFATDGQYNVYDRGLFTAQPTLSTLYRPKKDADDDMCDEQLEKIKKTERFKPDKNFAGAGEKSGPIDRPFEFEREVAEDADPFGVDLFIMQVKGGKKSLGQFGHGGTMGASDA